MSPLAQPRRFFPVPLAALGAVLLLAGSPTASRAQADSAGVRESMRVVADSAGVRLEVAGRDFLVRGVNWDYIPIGQNYSFDIWQQPEAVTLAAVDREMGLVAGMGANVIRIGVGIPPRWVRYLHDRYGIYCILNHPVGRYGITIDGVWHPNVDYADPRTRAALAADVAAAFAPYRGVPGVLMYLLGNENNYGLAWTSFEAAALPEGERDAARARFLYSLLDEIARATHAQDPGVPVAIANGDVQYLDVIAQECKDVDVLGCNVYRGISARDLFAVVHEKLGKPVMFSEFGADAFNARELHEDQAMQARYLIGQWREIYEQSAGHGREGNAIGGCVFQWSDGWWKFGQTTHLDIHDTNASWPDGGYVEDYQSGENNMNEEWWGICAKGLPDSRGLYELYPRAAYYALRRIFALDPYAPGSTEEVLEARFNSVTPAMAELEARGDRAALLGESSERARLAGMRLALETISTGNFLTRPPVPGDPPFKGTDRFLTFYTDFQASPAPQVTGRLSVNFRGEVPTNPIDQIFYENRSSDRAKVYRASVSWDDRWFALEGFYRTGHYHWGYEGDFFGLYREANYGVNVDTYDAATPLGVELAAKRSLTGLKLAVGSELWWGAPAAVLAKYRRQVGRIDAAAVYERDLPTQGKVVIVGSSPVALKPTSKATLHLQTTHGPFTLEAGGIWAGANRRGEPFQVAERDGASYRILRDRVRASDALGAKFRVAGTHGRLLWYAQGASMGLVAEGGPTATTTYTGWTLKDTGLGNQRNAIGGFVYNVGTVQLGPNFLWQKPIVGPMPADVPSPGRPRDILDDPFAVRGNREMTAAEMLVSFDPTPATWLYAWDNDEREDARLAGSLGYVYRHMPTNMDAAIGLLADGKTPFVFAGSTPPRDLWEVNGRLVSRVSAGLRILAHAYYGTGEPNLTNDPRLVTRYGGDLRVAGGGMMFAGYVKVNDWGPYDFYKDFNLTYPLQLMGDLSRSLGSPHWLESNLQTQVGVRATWRSLDQYSLRYYGLAGDPHGREWELRTYVHLAL